MTLVTRGTVQHYNMLLQAALGNGALPNFSKTLCDSFKISNKIVTTHSYRRSYKCLPSPPPMGRVGERPLRPLVPSSLCASFLDSPAEKKAKRAPALQAKDHIHPPIRNAFIAFPFFAFLQSPDLNHSLSDSPNM